MKTIIRAGTLIAGGAVVLLAIMMLAVATWTRLDPVDPAVLVDGETRTSFSGQYTSVFLFEEINGKRQLYPVIKNASGEVVWQDDQRYLMSAHPVGVVWQADADVLWLLSSDIGHSRVIQVNGAWTRDWQWDSLPEDIRAIAEG